MSYLSLNVSYHLKFMPLYKSKSTRSVRDVSMWRIHRNKDTSAEISLLMSTGFCKYLESQEVMVFTSSSEDSTLSLDKYRVKRSRVLHKLTAKKSPDFYTTRRIVTVMRGGLHHPVPYADGLKLLWYCPEIHYTDRQTNEKTRHYDTSQDLEK